MNDANDICTYCESSHVEEDNNAAVGASTLTGAQESVKQAVGLSGLSSNIVPAMVHFTHRLPAKIEPDALWRMGQTEQGATSQQFGLSQHLSLEEQSRDF